MAPVLAVVLGLLALGASLADVPLAIARHQTGPGGPVAYMLVTLAVAVPGAAVGVLLAARRPCNPIGWLLLALLLLAANPASYYAILDYRLHHGTLPLGWAAVVFLASSPAVPVLLAILLWVFPDGRLPVRWRPVARALIAAGVLLVVVTTVAPGVTAVAGHHVRIDTSGNLYPVSPAWTIAGNVAVVAAIASMLAWLAVQLPRYRRSSDERREQLKWLYSGATVLICTFTGALVGPSAAGEAFGADGPVVNEFIELGGSVFVICIGVAVLKYRLYAIDRIVSRVISYAVITAVLAGVFAGLVILATQVLPFKTPVAVAAATLAAAALFNPLRRRVQHAVDRRFNRARYDAETVVAAFTARLRHSADFDTVHGDLVSTVHQAFQPAHISLWSAPGPALRRRALAGEGGRRGRVGAGIDEMR
jgi:MFS family permease